MMDGVEFFTKRMITKYTAAVQLEAFSEATSWSDSQFFQKEHCRFVDGPLRTFPARSSA
jgi:hypothetical protein